MNRTATIRGLSKFGSNYCIALLPSARLERSSKRFLCHNTVGVVIENYQARILQSNLIAGQVCKIRGFADDKKIKLEDVKRDHDVKLNVLPNPSDLAHFRSSTVKDESAPVNKGDKQEDKKDTPPIGVYAMPHPIWTDDQLHSIEITHKQPEGIIDKMAYKSIQLIRSGFDLFSGFKFGETNEKKWINRICFLETVAAVPGMVAAMMRHMRSLRRMQRDQGWIHTLLEEAENERMHLLTALQLKQPSLMFRLCVIGSQGVFVTLFGIGYILSPKFCHRFVGYLEEEAVKTYTHCLKDIEQGNMKHWKTQPAPDVAVRYWKLKPDATMKDVILAIRADEAHHRVVNHCLASLKKDEFNPYKPGH